MIHLNRYHHFTQLMRTSDTAIRLTQMRSRFDGSAQPVLEIFPADRNPQVTFIFFHGMDGDAGDAVIVRQLVSTVGARIISVGRRGPTWVSDAFFSDVDQVIRENTAATESFYLMGVSMGAVQALSVPGLLDKNLSHRIQGVIALMPAFDLSYVSQHSSHERVRNTLKTCESSATLLERSPIHLLSEYPAKIPLSIFYRSEDTILPFEQRLDFVTRAKAKGHLVTEFVEPGNHDFTYADFDFVPLFEAVLS